MPRRVDQTPKVHLYGHSARVSGWRYPVAVCGHVPAWGRVTDDISRVTCLHCLAARGK